MVSHVSLYATSHFQSLGGSLGPTALGNAVAEQNAGNGSVATTHRSSPMGPVKKHFVVFPAASQSNAMSRGAWACNVPNRWTFEPQGIWSLGRRIGHQWIFKGPKTSSSSNRATPQTMLKPPSSTRRASATRHSRALLDGSHRRGVGSHPTDISKVPTMLRERPRPIPEHY